MNRFNKLMEAELGNLTYAKPYRMFPKFNLYFDNMFTHHPLEAISLKAQAQSKDTKMDRPSTIP